MLDYQLLPDQGILRIHPSSPLAARDMAQMTEVVDRYLASHDYLNGMLISSADAMAWEDFAAFIPHLNFSGDHQQRIKKVAAVADEKSNQLTPQIIDYFSKSEVKSFSVMEEQSAEDWLRSM